MDTASLLKWSISNPWCYVGYVLAVAVAVRIVLSLLRAFKYANEDKHANEDGRPHFGKLYWLTLKGFHPPVRVKTSEGEEKVRDVRSDHLSAFVLGLLELATYPVLIAINQWPLIGAWITLKTLAQWSEWQRDRGVFNLFLIGTVVNVLVAALALTQFVAVPSS